MSGIPEPEVIERTAFEAGYAMGSGLGIQALIKTLSEYNRVRGFGSNVTLDITYSVGVWYLKLEDASGRVVTYAHVDLRVALVEIFR